MPVSDTPDLLVLYLGIAARELDNREIEIAFCIHDGTYSTDFATHIIHHNSNRNRAQEVANYVITHIREYEKEHMHKYAGAGITENTKKISSTLPSRLWAELDIVPMVFSQTLEYQEGSTNKLEVDEQADSMARKCIVYVFSGISI